MTELITRVESTGFYAGQNRWVAIAVKVMVVSLVLWASLANDAGDILMDIQSATIGYFRGWYVYASAAFMVMSLALALNPRYRSHSPGSGRRQTRIQSLRLVLYDVWRRDRRGNADLFYR